MHDMFMTMQLSICSALESKSCNPDVGREDEKRSLLSLQWHSILPKSSCKAKDPNSYKDLCIFVEQISKVLFMEN